LDDLLIEERVFLTARLSLSSLDGADDEHYPYICASHGDRFPRLFVAPNKEEGFSTSQRYRYFGPYTSFREINAILEGVEEKYDLRAQSFLARHGGASQEEYKRLFETVLKEVFEGQGGREALLLTEKRKEYEEAGLLFDSDSNRCRDVVAVGREDEQAREIVVHVLQLREGIVAGRFSYSCELPIGFGDEDVADCIHTALTQRHYPSGENAQSKFSWFPDEVLLSHPPLDKTSLRKAIQESNGESEQKQKKKVNISTAAKTGPKKAVDARVLQFASENAKQAAIEKSLGSVKSLVDGSGAAELATLIGSARMPSRIECYVSPGTMIAVFNLSCFFTLMFFLCTQDVSHSQGEKAVASRVVFVDGKPVPKLYRKFNIKTVEGVDDYASLEEVLERRFRHVHDARDRESDNPWELPDLVVIDGGPGQLGAAIKGMAKAGVEASNNTTVADNGVVPEDDNRVSVPVCSIAKKEEQVFVPGSNVPVNNSKDIPAVLLLRALRDESHRFALRSHRIRRKLRGQTKKPDVISR